jgi:hypothetical protein
MTQPSARLGDSAAWPADILTAVVRVPSVVGDRVVETTDHLRRADPAPHHYYPAGSLHLTIRSLRGLAEGSAELEAALVELRARAIQCVAPTIGLRGMRIGSAGAAIPVYLGDAEQPLRDDASGSWAERDRRPHRHVNVARFMAPVSSVLERLIGEMGSVDFGTFTPEEIVVVRCDQVMALESLVIMERIPLRGPASA